ncbi:PD-(D/E)XK nuclease family protein [Schleiferiaceae bacterium]|nr:PD-(D/E)XK nuclease family protein [Schleiferiaceae bacterium]
MIKLSWSNLELFNECPRCFYFAVNYKVRRPSGFPLNFNNAIDRMMKDEMDIIRQKDVRQHAIEISGKEFVLSRIKSLGKWRHSSHGLCYQWGEDLMLKGVLDDVWEDSEGNLVVVDIKSTATVSTMSSLPRWSDKIKRQLSFYAYLLKQLGYDVSDNSVIFYVVGKIKKDGLLKNMEFDYHKFIVQNDLTWINPRVQEALATLKSNGAPEGSERCVFCKFEQRSQRVFKSSDTPDAP